MGIIGDLSTNDDLGSKHNERDDISTVLFHVGQSLHGGGTDYYTGLTSEVYGTLAKHILCHYGRLTIEYLDKIIQFDKVSEGSRGFINFNLKKKCLNIF